MAFLYIYAFGYLVTFLLTFYILAGYWKNWEIKNVVNRFKFIAAAVFVSGLVSIFWGFMLFYILYVGVKTLRG